MHHAPDRSDPRLVAANDRPVRGDGRYVLYWMRANRRTIDNFALDRAVARCRALGRPLLVFEGLRCDYPWAADRHHAFVLAGMRDNRQACLDAGITYHGHVAREPGADRGLLRALADHACVVVTDLHPGFHYPRMLEAAARALPVRVEAVDACGLVPLSAVPSAAPTAYAFRRALQRLLPDALGTMPAAAPLRSRGLGGAPLPAEIAARWPAVDDALLRGDAAALARLPIDHGAGVVALPGGPRAALARLRRFVDARLDDYAQARNHPDHDAGSGLSPYLHFGHVSPHTVLRAIARRFEWSPADLGALRNGAREGYWGLPAPVEAFLDQLVTWRELGHNFAAHRDDIDRFESLPSWAQATLAAHAGDPRPWRYDLDALTEARTHDPLWNAAQTELRERGVMHNYLRMLWAKLVLQWSATPREALASLIELNNRWALDGRDPNSYSGILWTFGRYDRPWGPARPVFGTVRCMTSDSARRKLDLEQYLERWGAQRSLVSRSG
ncbi:MAG: deoxyribodipyrimidine photolyase [Nannocystaceae bacterium]|nr:deoxyribodipyrimidine photolyase [Nannocystaceae bacterium]